MTNQTNLSENHSGSHHIMPLWIYLAVGGTLLLLTGLTITVAEVNLSEITGFPEMNFIVAMVIATIKSSLVILFFMHLFYDNKFYLFLLASAIVCLMIFITLTLADLSFRGDVNAIEKNPIVEQTPKDKFEKAPEHHSEHEQKPEHSDHK